MHFSFNAPATTETYTLSLHDALPIYMTRALSDEQRNALLAQIPLGRLGAAADVAAAPRRPRDRKSTRLNSSHRCISYAVFCLKQKKIHYGRLPLRRASAPPVCTDRVH